MAAQDIWAELVGDIPGLPFPKAKTIANEALNLIYDQIFWSFQYKESQWLTPGLQFGTTSAFQSNGSITVRVNSTQVIGDATASAAWAAYVAGNNYPLITAYQLRLPNASLYNIIAYDTTSNPPFGTLTLDRPWFERTFGSGISPYMVYQAYFPVPVIDFKRFLNIQDFTNAAPLDFWSYSRADLAVIDPQRVNYNQPAYVVPYEVDARPGSPTLGFMLYELWPHPLSVLPYNFAYLRRGPLLSLPTDTVPLPLTDELVKWRAREVAYLWKEAQKSDGIQKGDGANYQFLSIDAGKQYEKRWKTIADRDRDLALTYFNRYIRNAAIAQTGEPFATITSGLNVGRM